MAGPCALLRRRRPANAPHSGGPREDAVSRQARRPDHGISGGSTTEQDLGPPRPATSTCWRSTRRCRRLALANPRLAEMVELHYFGGLTYQELSETLKVSEATVDREIRLAKAWILKEIRPNRKRRTRVAMNSADTGKPIDPRWERLQELFSRAVDLPEDERRAFLAREIGGRHSPPARIARSAGRRLRRRRRKTC